MGRKSIAVEVDRGNPCYQNPIITELLPAWPLAMGNKDLWPTNCHKSLRLLAK